MSSKSLLFLCALFSLLCMFNYILVHAEDTEQVEFVTVGTEEYPEDNTQEDIEDGSSDNSTDTSEEAEELTEESTEDEFDYDFNDDEESTESETEETTEHETEESTEQQPEVNCSYSDEDLQDLEDKVDLSNDLLKYIMYSIWSCTGLYMGSKLIRGLFNE